jgi:hypothetical protein
MTAVLKKIWADQLRLLSFRQLKLDLANFNAYLLHGLLITWLCGIGRYWDNPRADLWQYLGLGSVAYIFILAGLLWLLILPLKPAHWSYRNVLLFISLTSLPALLYAIPVERFMSMEHAQWTNVWFLGIVATWRVALLFVYLKRVAQLPVTTVLIATFLPLTLIITALTTLNLEHVVFNIMAGLDSHEESANDAAYNILFLLTWFSVLAFPFLLFGYVHAIFTRRANSSG